jgi:hypothetical protein
MSKEILEAVWAAILPVRDSEAAEHSLIGAKMQPVRTKQWQIRSAQSVNCARNSQIEKAVGGAWMESKATRRATRKRRVERERLMAGENARGSSLGRRPGAHLPWLQTHLPGCKEGATGTRG